MTRPEIVVNTMEHLIGILDLEKIEENLYRGSSPNVGWQRVFGGLVVSQALVAAQRTVDAGRFVHSLHSYFLRPGDPAVPILYQVERIRDGSSFTTRRVVAVQHGRPIFTLSASFQLDEPGFEHQSAMPDVPPPEALDDPATVAEKFLKGAPEHIRRYWLRERPFEMRPVSMTHYISDEPLPALQHIWVKPNGPIPDDRALQSAFLAYLSDMTILDTSLFPHGRSVFDQRLQVASLDHAMWFHGDAKIDGWFLYSQDSPFGGGARGLSRGAIYSRSGRIIASVAQEGLIRNRADD